MFTCGTVFKWNMLVMTWRSIRQVMGTLGSRLETLEYKGYGDDPRGRPRMGRIVCKESRYDQERANVNKPTPDHNYRPRPEDSSECTIETRGLRDLKARGLINRNLMTSHNDHVGIA
jgi:hypothetical protein